VPVGLHVHSFCKLKCLLPLLRSGNEQAVALLHLFPPLPFALSSLYFSTNATFRFSAFFMWNPAGGVGSFTAASLILPAADLPSSPRPLALDTSEFLPRTPLGLFAPGLGIFVCAQ
jgi:hypothetical protein